MPVASQAYTESPSTSESGSRACERIRILHIVYCTSSLRKIQYPSTTAGIYKSACWATSSGADYSFLDGVEEQMSQSLGLRKEQDLKNNTARYNESHAYLPILLGASCPGTQPPLFTFVDCK